MTRISVIIPTYNRVGLLERVLPSYLAQAGLAEVIVVDDGSTPSVDDVLAPRFRDHAALRVIRNPRSLGPSAARNVGIRAAQADWVFFGEDDVVLGGDHLERLTAARTEMGAALVCGRLFQQQADEDFRDVVSRQERGREPVFNRRIISVTTAGVTEPMEVPFAHCLVLTDTALAQEHLYSTKYGGPSFMREDAEFQLRLRSHGKRLWVTPDANLVHLAKRRGAGAGTRDYASMTAQVASTVANLSMLIDTYHNEMAPFFGSMPRDEMIRRACLGHAYLAMKNWARGNSVAVDKTAELWNRARWLLSGVLD